MSEEKTVLLVEDNRNDEELTLRALKRTEVPHQPVVARDGEEALDYLLGQGQYASRDVSRTPALILLDLKLPKVDGLELLRQIRADDRTRFVPVVMLTSSTHEKDIVDAYRAGCNSYLHKAVDFADFGEMTKQLLSYWLQLNVDSVRGLTKNEQTPLTPYREYLRQGNLPAPTKRQAHPLRKQGC
jgi:CheY-like chemotaxis protein